MLVAVAENSEASIGPRMVTLPGVGDGAGVGSSVGVGLGESVGSGVGLSGATGDGSTGDASTGDGSTGDAAEACATAAGDPEDPETKTSAPTNADSATMPTAATAP
jgi:hypothetical protein